MEPDVLMMMMWWDICTRGFCTIASIVLDFVCFSLTTNSVFRFHLHLCFRRWWNTSLARHDQSPIQDKNASSSSSSSSHAWSSWCLYRAISSLTHKMLTKHPPHAGLHKKTESLSHFHTYVADTAIEVWVVPPLRHTLIPRIVHNQIHDSSRDCVFTNYAYSQSTSSSSSSSPQVKRKACSKRWYVETREANELFT